MTATDNAIKNQDYQLDELVENERSDVLETAYQYVQYQYVAKDLECTEENIKDILKDKDISKGMVVFINEGQENDPKLEVILNATGLKKCDYLKRLNACDVYYAY